MPRIPLPTKLAECPFTVEEGLAAGLSTKRLQGADLQRPFRGIRTTTAPSDVGERARAFQLGAPPDTFVCGITAAAIMRIPLPMALERTRLLHVAVPSPQRAPKAAGTVGHSFLIEPTDLRDWGGLRITTPERTWCDLATVLNIPDLVAAGDYLIHWETPMASLGSLELALRRHRGRRGRAKLIRAIDQLDDRAESPKESHLRLIVKHGGIEGVVVNYWIRTSGGYEYRADLAVPTRKFTIEYQSRFHDVSKNFQSDMTRISRLEADGWFVMQVNNEDLKNAPELVQRIRTALKDRVLTP